MIYGSGKYTYEVVEGWAKLPEGRELGLVSSMACDSQNRVYVFNRSPQPAVLVFDHEGNFLKSWGEDIFTSPHGIWISPDDQIYCTDTEDHTVRILSLDGEILMTIGTEGQPGEPGAPFNQPTRALLGPSGDIYVSDGYGQSRVHRFSKDGKLLRSWGEDGEGPGQFNLPHNIWVDPRERALVVDRGNSRVQVFNSDGEYLTEWPELLSPNEIYIDENETVYIAEGGQRISIMNLEGEVLVRWGEKGDAPGQFSDSPHGIWVDSHGDIYVSEVVAEKRFQKFAKI
ncbi:hypothetical protein H8E77_38960 [bacterium]|nr:hypothetical protein [bacterium]